MLKNDFFRRKFLEIIVFVGSHRTIIFLSENNVEVIVLPGKIVKECFPLQIFRNNHFRLHSSNCSCLP